MIVLLYYFVNVFPDLKCGQQRGGGVEFVLAASPISISV